MLSIACTQIHPEYIPVNKFNVNLIEMFAAHRIKLCTPHWKNFNADLRNISQNHRKTEL